MKNFYKYPIDISCDSCYLAIGFDDDGNKLCCGSFYGENIDNLVVCSDYKMSISKFNKICVEMEKVDGFNSYYFDWDINIKDKCIYFTF